MVSSVWCTGIEGEVVIRTLIFPQCLLTLSVCMCAIMWLKMVLTALSWVKWEISLAVILNTSAHIFRHLCRHSSGFILGMSSTDVWNAVYHIRRAVPNKQQSILHDACLNVKLFNSWFDAQGYLTANHSDAIQVWNRAWFRSTPPGTALKQTLVIIINYLFICWVIIINFIFFLNNRSGPTIWHMGPWQSEH